MKCFNSFSVGIKSYNKLISTSCFAVGLFLSMILNKDDMIADLEMIIQVQQKKLNERNGKNAKGEEEKTKTNIKE